MYLGIEYNVIPLLEAGLSAEVCTCCSSSYIIQRIFRQAISWQSVRILIAHLVKLVSYFICPTIVFTFVFVSAKLYEAVLLWFYGINRTLTLGQEPDNGLQLTSNMLNFTFDGGVNGNVSIDGLGDRKTGYTVVIYQPIKETGMMQVCNF